MISSWLRAWISRKTERMPGLSIWKQPMVPPLSTRAEVSGSSLGIDSSTAREPAYSPGWLPGRLRAGGIAPRRLEAAWLSGYISGAKGTAEELEELLRKEK